jgi:hypothetical protein
MAASLCISVVMRWLCLGNHRKSAGENASNQPYSGLKESSLHRLRRIRNKPSKKAANQKRNGVSSALSWRSNCS